MKIRYQANHQPSPWVLDIGVRSGRRRRRFFRTEAEANAAAARHQRDAANIGKGWATLPAATRQSILATLAEIREAGVTLAQAWAAYRLHRLAPPAAAAPSLAATITEVVAAKRAANRRPDYLNSLENYLKAFAKGRELLPISHVTPATIDQWFAARREKPSTHSGHIGRLSALFQHAVRRRYITDNPCRFIDRPTIDQPTPRILTPRQAAKLLVIVRREKPSAIPYLALALFAGLRPLEIIRLDWSAVNLDQARVSLDAADAKDRRRRIVTLHPTAVAWLRPHKRARGRVSNKTTSIHYTLHAAAKRARITWQHDILRHTAASYLLALHQDAAKVALSLGNSPAILFRHYHSPVTPEASARFWALAPKPVPAT